MTLAVEGLHGLLHWDLLAFAAQDLHTRVQGLHEAGQKGPEGARDALLWGLFPLIHDKSGFMFGNKTLDENPSFCQGLFDVGAPGLVSLLVL